MVCVCVCVCVCVGGEKESKVVGTAKGLGMGLTEGFLFGCCQALRLVEDAGDWGRRYIRKQRTDFFFACGRLRVCRLFQTRARFFQFSSLPYLSHIRPISSYPLPVFSVFIYLYQWIKVVLKEWLFTSFFSLMSSYVSTLSRH